MHDRILLSIFFPCLIGCAGIVLFGIWTGGGGHNPALFQTAATLFVVGLSAFLTWFILTMHRLLTPRE